jgi:hypothetical protein
LRYWTATPLPPAMKSGCECVEGSDGVGVAVAVAVGVGARLEVSASRLVSRSA